MITPGKYFKRALVSCMGNWFQLIVKSLRQLSNQLITSKQYQKELTRKCSSSKLSILRTLNIKNISILQTKVHFTLFYSNESLINPFCRHGTIIRTGITCKKSYCYMRDSSCRWFIVRKAKIFWSYVKHFWILAVVRKCKILISLCKQGFLNCPTIFLD